MENFDLKKYLAESRLLKEDIDTSSKDGYIAFIDNEDIFGTYGLEDAEEMARELAMNHHSAGQDQDNFVKSFMAAYKEGGYMTEGQLEENSPHPTDVFSDEQLDYVTDMLKTMYEKLGLEKSPGETDVVKANALMDRIEGFFETLD